jgi:hypothetical protein
LEPTLKIDLTNRPESEPERDPDPDPESAPEPKRETNVLWTGLSSVGCIFGARFGALVKTAVGHITDTAAPERERHIPLVQPLWEFVQCNKRFRRPVIRHDEDLCTIWATCESVWVACCNDCSLAAWCRGARFENQFGLAR